ncbi:MAG: DinB family protein [Bacteroidia bacterium]
MEATTERKSSMHTLIDLYDWHTKLYKNAIESISDKDAQNRLNTKANHVAWLAGSLVHERYELAKFLNVNLKPTSHELFMDHKGIQDNVTYPSLTEFKKDWETISPVLRNALDNVSIEQLHGPDPYEMPGENLTFLDSITACTDRESYCIGQIGLWRRLLGYDAMKYE